MVALEVAQKEMARRGKIAKELIALERPELINLFFTYQNEAVFARKSLDDSLIHLDMGAEILEIGGGILALAIQLASEGYKVTTVEPVGEGFSDISFIMKIFSEIANSENLNFELIESPIEVCRFDHKFDFIFSINVMEHLKDPYSVLHQMVEALKPGGIYRFFCPNYNFPYEPHFSKWLWRRRENSFYLEASRAIGLDLDSMGQQELYKSLHFITLHKLELFCKQNQISVLANKFALSNLIERALNDSNLKGRHKSLTIILKIFNLSRLVRIAPYINPNFQPTIDVTVFSQNKTNSKSYEL
jgi:2-polyprenyl-3-methyl-5-hydroxy-6-metoxy-1,4-benzoquinol methylase